MCLSSAHNSSAPDLLKSSRLSPRSSGEQREAAPPRSPGAGGIAMVVEKREEKQQPPKQTRVVNPFTGTGGCFRRVLKSLCGCWSSCSVFLRMSCLLAELSRAPLAGEPHPVGLRAAASLGRFRLSPPAAVQAFLLSQVTSATFPRPSPKRNFLWSCSSARETPAMLVVLPQPLSFGCFEKFLFWCLGGCRSAQL